MSGFTVERSGFTALHGTTGFPGKMGLAQSLMSDLLSAGFRKVFPTNAISGDTAVAVLESTAAVDPLAEAGQKWRIRINSDKANGGVYINVATEMQIPDDGTGVAKHSTGVTSGHIIGSVGEGPAWGAGEIPFLNQNMFYPKADEDPESAPLSYRLSVSDHGILFCTWKQARDDTGNMFNWMLVQRPVDPANGQVLVDSYAPVFCVYSAGGGGESSGHFYSIEGKEIDSALEVLESTLGTGGNGQLSRASLQTMRTQINSKRTRIADPSGIRRFVVRETDVTAPTPSVSAVVPTRDSNAIINPVEQVSISVDNKYMVVFPSGLNTQRRAYKHELDMLAYTSADVISQDSDVSVVVFGEETPRTYKAMQANGDYNTGMRILMLTEGGGITGEAPAEPEPTP